MENIFRFADDLGPEKIIYIHNRSAGLKAIVVVDNVACGPSIGGVRMAPDVSVEEACRLARAMTLKNVMAGIHHGGGKAVIFGDPAMPLDKKENLIRAFAVSIKDIYDYIPGPDMGTNELTMAWINDETGRAVGLPPEIGGIPLDHIGATGFGLSVCAEEAVEAGRIKLKGARLAVQGFGSVGKFVARFLDERGAVLVAAADAKGTVYNSGGIDVDSLIEMKESGKSVTDYPDGKKLARDAIVDVECDIWIPAARPDVIHMDNFDRLKAKMVLPGANIPVTKEAEEALTEKGVLVLPDFIANSGGVICAAVEYHGGTEELAFQVIEEKVRKNTRMVLEESAKTGEPPTKVAAELAQKFVKTASSYRRWP